MKKTVTLAALAVASASSFAAFNGQMGPDQVFAEVQAQLDQQKLSADAVAGNAKRAGVKGADLFGVYVVRFGDETAKSILSRYYTSEELSSAAGPRRGEGGGWVIRKRTGEAGEGRRPVAGGGAGGAGGGTGGGGGRPVSES